MLITKYTAPLMACLSLVTADLRETVSSRRSGSKYATSNHTLSARDERCNWKTFNELVFDIPLDEFIKARESKDPPCWDWSSNGCSKVPNSPFGFHFLPCCQRHDFAYHNGPAIGLSSCDEKSAIDTNFHNDMKSVCDKHSWLGKKTCHLWAHTYHTGVVKFGHKSDWDC